MKIKILMIALVLCAAGNLFAENILVNPGFETGNTGWFGDTGFTIPGWSFWGTDGWCHSNAGNYFGTRAILIWTDAPGVFQDITVTEGTEYSFSVAARSPSTDSNGLHGRDGVLSIEWYDVDSYLIYSEEVGRFYGGLNDSVPVDPYNTWKVISGKFTAPVPAVKCRVFLHLVYNDGAGNGVGGIVCWDNVFAGTGNSCGITALAGDVNNDCYVNFVDFALMGENWLKCNNIFDSNCQ